MKSSDVRFANLCAEILKETPELTARGLIEAANQRKYGYIPYVNKIVFIMKKDPRFEVVKVNTKRSIYRLNKSGV